MSRSLKQHLPPTEPIGVYQGDTHQLVIDFTQTDEVVDLSGATVLAEIRQPDGTLVDTFTYLVEGSLGRVTLSLSATQTAALPVGILNSDVQITRGTDVTTYLRLRIQVVADVSE